MEEMSPFNIKNADNVYLGFVSTLISIESVKALTLLLLKIREHVSSRHPKKKKKKGKHRQGVQECNGMAILFLLPLRSIGFIFSAAC